MGTKFVAVEDRTKWSSWQWGASSGLFSNIEYRSSPVNLRELHPTPDDLRILDTTSAAARNTVPWSPAAGPGAP
jgi:hypothetical protein